MQVLEKGRAMQSRSSRQRTCIRHLDDDEAPISHAARGEILGSSRGAYSPRNIRQILRSKI
jgi:hypothetical protein